MLAVPAAGRRDGETACGSTGLARVTRCSPFIPQRNLRRSFFSLYKKQVSGGSCKHCHIKARHPPRRRTICAHSAGRTPTTRALYRCTDFSCFIFTGLIIYPLSLIRYNSTHPTVSDRGMRRQSSRKSPDTAHAGGGTAGGPGDGQQVRVYYSSPYSRP